MAIQRYKSSKKGVKQLIGFFAFMMLVVIVVAVGPKTTIGNLLEALVIFILMFSILAFSVWASYIEIDETKRTIMYCNWPMKSEPVSIDKIIQVGYPQQNYVVKSLDSFVYIWYDDPKNPDRDKYIKIRDMQFDPQTIIQVATDLKKLNPQIKFDDKLKELVKS